MRLFYDDDLECVFHYLTPSSCCVATCVDKTWKRVILPILVSEKKKHIENLFPSLNKLLYWCHKWQVYNGSIQTQYNHHSNSCLAFHHSNFFVSGTRDHNHIDVDCASLCEISFIENLMKLDRMFSNLNQVGLIARGGTHQVDITATWQNDFVQVVMKGYSPITCGDIGESGEFDLKYHINWEKSYISKV